PAGCKITGVARHSRRCFLLADLRGNPVQRILPQQAESKLRFLEGKRGLRRVVYVGALAVLGFEVWVLGSGDQRLGKCFSPRMFVRLVDEKDEFALACDWCPHREQLSFRLDPRIKAKAQILTRYL